MAVTYGYATRKGDMSVTSMQHAADTFLRAVTPEPSALSTVFPCSGFLLSKYLSSTH